LQQKSDRIQLLEFNECPELSSYFRRIVFDGVKTDFVCCNQCFGSSLSSRTTLRRHLKICRVNNELKIVEQPATEEQLNDSNDSTDNSMKRKRKIPERFDPKPPKRGFYLL